MGRARGRTYELKARFSVEADVKGVEALEARLSELEKRLNKLGGKNVRAKVGVTGEKQAGQSVDNMQKKLDKIEHTTAEAEIKIRERDEAKMNQKLDFLGAKLDKMFSRPYEMELQGNAKQAEAVMRRLATQANDMTRRAYELEITAETRGFTEAQDRADALKREAIRLSQMRANLAVELRGVPQALAGLVAVKRAAEGVEGEYEIKLDVDKLRAGALAAGALGGAVKGLKSHLMNAGPLMDTIARKTYIVQQSMYVARLAIMGVAIAAAGPLVAGLTIAAFSLATAAAGFGLLALAAIPIVSAFTKQAQSATKLKSAQDSMRSSTQALASAQDSLSDAQSNVADTAQAGREAIRSAIDAHKDSIQAVAEARRGLGDANRGVQEAEIAGEESIRQAIEAHRQAIQGVADARRSYQEALRGVHEAEISGEQAVKSAIDAHRDSIQAVADARRGVADAQRGVLEAEQSAEEGVRSAIEAHRQSLQDIASAQYDYRTAQQATADSVDDLRYATMSYNDALATEQMRIQSMQLDLQGMVLSQKQLALEIEEARKAIAEAETPEEREAAELRYQQLLLQRKQSYLDIENAQRELNDAEKNGTQELQSAAQQRKDAAKGVIDAKHQQAEAARRVTEAERSEAEAARDINKARKEGIQTVREAQRQVATAQRGLMDALKAERAAQNDIAQARKDAARAVKDAQRQAKEAQRGIVEALRAERDAQKDIGQARKDAAQGMKDAQRAVLDAQRNINDAIKNERQAQKEISKARQDAAEQNADAQKAVRDAMKAVAQAQREVNRAQRELEKLQRQSNLPQYLDDLKKEAKKTWAAWKKESRPVQKDMAQFATDILKFSRGIMPQLAKGAQRTFNSVRRAIMDTARAWKKNNVFNSIHRIFKNMPTITGRWTKALGNLLGVFLNIWAEAMPFARRFSRAVSQITREWLKWSASKKGRKEIRQFFESAAPVAKALWKWISKIAVGLLAWSVSHPKEVATAIDIVGTVLYGVLSAVGAVIRAFIWLDHKTNGWSTKFLGGLLGLYAVFRMIPKPVRQIIAWLWKLGKPMLSARLAALGFRGILFAVGRFILTKVPLWALAFSAIWNGLKEGWTAIKELFNTFRGYNKQFGSFGQNWGMWLWNGFRQVIASMVKWMLKTVIGVLEDIGGFVKDTLNWLPGNWGDKMFPDTKAQEARKAADKLYEKIRGSANIAAESIGKNMGKSSDESTKHVQEFSRKGQFAIKDFGGGSWKTMKDWQKDTNNTTENTKETSTKNAWDLNRQSNKAFSDMFKESQKKFGDIHGVIGKETREAKEDSTKNSWDMNKSSVKAHEDYRKEVKSKQEDAKGYVDDNTDRARVLSMQHNWDMQRSGEKAMESYRDRTGKLTAEASLRMANNTHDGSQKALMYLGELTAGVIEFVKKLGIDWEGIKDAAKGLPVIGPAVSLADFFFAKGGTYQGPTGGMADGQTMRVYGEVPGTTEYYITDNPRYKKQNLDLLAKANMHMATKFGGEEHQHARGGVEYFRGGGTWDAGGSASVPWLSKANAEIEAQFGVNGTTYSGHGAQANSMTSADYLVSQGGWNTVATGAAKAKGDSIVRFIESQYKAITDYIIWFTQANYGNGWQKYTGGGGYAYPSSPSGFHQDHVHWSVTPGGQNQGYGGGFTGGVDISAELDKYIPKPPNFNDGITGKLYSGIAQKAYDTVVSVLSEKAGGAGAIAGNSPAGLTIGEVVNQTWPQANERPQATAIAWRESNGQADIQNLWDSNAKAGHPSTGLFQIILPTAQSVDPSATTEKLKDPLYNSGVAAKIQDAQGWGPWTTSAGWQGYTGHENAPVTGYSHGGVATGPQVGLIGDRGNEVMMPLDDPRAVRMLQHAFDMSKKVTPGGEQRAAIRASGGVSVHKHGDGSITITQTQRGGAGQDASGQTSYLATKNAHRTNMAEGAFAGHGIARAAGGAYAGNTLAQAGGVSADAAHIGRAIDRMTDRVVEATREDKKLHKDSIEDMVAVVLHGTDRVLRSNHGKDLVDEAIGEKLDFDRLLRGL